MYIYIYIHMYMFITSMIPLVLDTVHLFPIVNLIMCVCVCPLPGYYLRVLRRLKGPGADSVSVGSFLIVAPNGIIWPPPAGLLNVWDFLRNLEET